MSRARCDRVGIALRCESPRSCWPVQCYVEFEFGLAARSQNSRSAKEITMHSCLLASYEKDSGDGQGWKAQIFVSYKTYSAGLECFSADRTIIGPNNVNSSCV